MPAATTTANLTQALEGIDALSIETVGDRTELKFNSYENNGGVNLVVVEPAGKCAFTGEDTYSVKTYRARRHAGETIRLRGEARAVFAISLREVIESQVWS